MSSGGEDQNNNTTLLQGSRLLYKTQDGNESVGLNSYLDPSTNAVMGLVIFNELNDPPNQTRISINNQGITETFANGDPSINVSWENFYLLKQATPALRLPDASNVFTVCNTYEANDNNLAKTKIAKMSADASANPLVSLNIVATGETATLTQNGLTYLPTTAGTPSTRTWADIIASTGSTNTIQQVLDNGNTATGANAKIGLTDSGIGNVANPQLTLNNSNATAGAINGVPCVEYYKSGRNATTGDTIATQTFQAKNASGTKTEYARLETAVRGSGAFNDDGSLGFYFATNGVLGEVFRMNGADNENNSYRPLDMNGNALRSTTTNLTLDTTASTGTGDIFILPKATTGFVKVSKDILTDNSIRTLSATGSEIDFGGATTDYRFTIDADTTEHYWNDGTDQSTLTLDNDLASKNNTISQFYQSPTGNIQTLIQSIPTIQKIQQIDTINNWTATYYPIKIDLVADSGATTTSIKNKDNASENRIDFFKSQGGGVYCNAGIVNNNALQRIYLSNTDNALEKSINISTDPTGLSSIVHSNTRDGNPFSITTNTDLVVESTKVGGSAELSSVGGVQITGDTGINLLTTVPASAISFQTDGITFTGASLEDTTSTGSSGKYLKIILNGTAYKIPLDNI